MTLEILSVDDVLDGIDFNALIRGSAQEDPFLRSIQDRAHSKLVPFTPITPEERLQSFAQIGYRPHGVYVPDDATLKDILNTRLKDVGEIPEVGRRFSAYFDLQRECESWQINGQPGHWTGQQAIARSKAQFRIVAYGRRGGKSLHASREAVGLALFRPRSWIWVAGPTMTEAGRVFEMVTQLLSDLGVKIVTHRDTKQEKLVIIENGSKIEGISLEAANAGAAVDLAIIDEAAQIDPVAWNRIILPPLTDRNGQALLISSWEGDSGFFYRKMEDAKDEMIYKGDDSTWGAFRAPSYEVNFFMFPQGRNSTAIKRAAEEMKGSPQDFLEQFGAVPAGSRDKVFPEFKYKAHVGNFPFNPDHPVVLAVDPSGGANAYAVAVIQDYGDYFNIVDEFYESRMAVEEISPILRKRPWADNVTDVIVDSALPVEIQRWVTMGWPAYPVSAKPQVWERIPLYRNMLRDPLRFGAFYRKKVNEILKERGLPEDFDLLPETMGGMDVADQMLMTLEIEDRLSDVEMSDEDIATLRGCTRVRINKTCYNTIEEHKKYSYPKRRKEFMNQQEKPLDSMNHILDALGYFVWQTRRFEGMPGSIDWNMIESTNTRSPVLLTWSESEETENERLEIPGGKIQRMQGFLQQVRTAYSVQPVRDYSILGQS